MSTPIEIALDAPGARLDRALALAHPALSRVQWQRLIRDGAVTIDGAPVKASLKLEAPVIVTAQLPEVKTVDVVPQAIPLTIVYEDADCLVVDKPAGMVVHPGAGHEDGTLVNAVLHHCADITGVGHELRPGIVHRLDKDTSGLIVVAKNDSALRHLQAQFAARTVQKRYLALVYGHVQPPEALIDAPIGRDPAQRKRMSVIAPGSRLKAREAQTRYRTQQVFDDYTLVECRPLTGRTHQIRVHMAYIGYPLVGDEVYSRRKERLGLKRHFLHAAALTFGRPSDDAPIALEAPLPPELAAVLARLAND